MMICLGHVLNVACYLKVNLLGREMDLVCLIS